MADTSKASSGSISTIIDHIGRTVVGKVIKIQKILSHYIIR